MNGQNLEVLGYFTSFTNFVVTVTLVEVNNCERLILCDFSLMKYRKMLALVFCLQPYKSKLSQKKIGTTCS